MATRQHSQGWKAGFISRRSTAIVAIAREITRYLRGGFRCTKVSASGKFPAFVIMMLSQLGSEIIAGATAGRIPCLLFSSCRRSSSRVFALDTPPMHGGCTGAARDT
jgi:hypothetical protein